MANQSLSLLLRYIRHLAQAPSDSQTSDHELLERFLQQRDQPAFEALVRRHGAMVFNVAQRLLQNGHDAEDVFQATFLTLARKADSLRKPGSLACWLHGVAHRLALQMRDAAVNRSAHESRIAGPASPDHLAEITLREAHGLLDLELKRLSAKYRAPLVLCYLEGATRDEAARQLHVSLATLKRRLERGRELLRIRLTHRGLTVPTALSAVLLAENAAQTAVPAPMVSSMIHAAMLLAAGKPVVTGLVSPKAAALMEGMVRLMWITKLHTTAWCCALAVALTGTSILAHQVWARKSPEPPPRQALVSVVQDSSKRPPTGKELPSSDQPEELLKVSEGKNYFLSPITTELQRSLLPAHFRRAWAYVIFDAGVLVRADGTIDPSGLNWEALRKAIRPPEGRKDAVVVFNPIHPHGIAPKSSQEVLRWCLEGFGHDLGFAKAYQSYTYNRGYNWDSTRAAIAEKMGGKPDAAEPLTGNSAVEVYPVRTLLSRHLTDNAECVVRIVAPFKDPSSDRLDPEVEKAIRTYVNDFVLETKDHLRFRVAYKNGARDAVERFGQTSAKKLAEELGFKNSTLQSWYEP